MASDRINAIAKHITSPAAGESALPDAWSGVAQAPPDAIFKLTAGYNADTAQQKVNLGVGAYRDDQGRPFVLPSVQAATRDWLEDPVLNHEYLPITGLPAFTKAAAELVFAPSSPALAQNRVASVQTISGTGANHLGALFLSKFYSFPNGTKQLYLSNPTWANHKAILTQAGIKPIDYAYYDPKTISLDESGFLDTLEKAADGSVFLLHACAHNPTGVDPTREQWTAIADVFARKRHFAFFDCAYQGFASGDLDADAWAVRHFVERGDIPLLVCQSFAKNAGLYGERIGALHIVSPTHAAQVKSQLSTLTRSEISNPPAYGAQVVTRLLTQPKLFSQWKEDVQGMSYRIQDMRKALRQELETLQTPPPAAAQDWSHITKQIGMFCFTGLTSAQCQSLIDQHHIYLTANGRISMAGLNSQNVQYVAKAFDQVIRS